MNQLYIVEAIDHIDYDEYDSVVVSALSECDAKQVAMKLISSHHEVEVTKISESSLKPRGIIHDSFNAG